MGVYEISGACYRHEYIEDMRNVNRILIRIHEGYRPVSRSKYSWSVSVAVVGLLRTRQLTERCGKCKECLQPDSFS